MCRACWRRTSYANHTLSCSKGCGCLLLIVLAFAVLGQIGQNSLTDPARTSSLSAPAPSEKETVANLLKLDFTWGARNSIMIANFTITNSSTVTVKDIEIRCTHSGPSGTEIDSNTRTIYEIIPAKGKKRVREFNMGFIHSQAASSGCAIRDFVIVR
jgi:hypothetical protein